MSDAPAMTAPVEELLSRFPGPITLYPSREKWALLAAGSAPLAITGAILIPDGSAHSLWGWIVFVVFGACLLVSGTRLLPGAAALTLDIGGFEEHALFFQRARAQWRDATDITANAAPDARSDIKLVWFNAPEWKGHWLRGKEAVLPGCNAGLADTYGLSAEDLADLMIRWQQRAHEAPQHNRDRVDRLI
jgi:hypothetical protein